MREPEPQFFLLERIVRRAPLGLRFRDLSREANINSGLTVLAWPVGSKSPAIMAARSPVSGIYGYRSLPGLEQYERDERPASDWCPPGQNGDGQPNFVIYIRDDEKRYLPQVLLMCLPKEKVIEVPLHPTPSLLPLPAVAVIRAELWDAAANAPAAWALVTASAPGSDQPFATVADARGQFVLFMPYPPPAAAPNNGQVALRELEWPLTFRIFYQPGTQQWLDPTQVPEGLRAAPFPPESASIIRQQPALIFPTPLAGEVTLIRPLRNRTELILKTSGQSRLWIRPV
jgi:hypothetical protein